MLISKCTVVLIIIVSTCFGIENERTGNGTAIKNPVIDEMSKIRTISNIDNLKSIDNKTLSIHRGREGVTPMFMEGQSFPAIELNNKSKSIPLNSSSSSNPVLIPAVPSLQTTVSIGNSSVHARKGVSQEITSIETVLVTNKPKIDVINDKTSNHTTLTSHDNITRTSSELGSSTTVAMNITASTTTATTTTTKKIVPKKPLITMGTAEAFPETDFQSTSKEVLKSNTSTLTDNVVQANPQVQKNEDSSTKGPGYIIPIVIPIFALPLLGLIGYKAIRHGREAWRNRHYRRMDFLIDGMYND